VVFVVVVVVVVVAVVAVVFVAPVVVVADYMVYYYMIDCHVTVVVVCDLLCYLCYHDVAATMYFGFGYDD
jgi:hypothetical protein